MEAIEIILITISFMLISEGIFLSLFSKQIAREIKKIAKDRKTIVKIGLIEIILALIILFMISL